MTENIYSFLPKSFKTSSVAEPTKKIPLSLFNNINNTHDLCMDENDIKFYTEYFKKLNRDPTNVELFDLSQSNSEHSRHWIFNGKICIDGRL